MKAFTEERLLQTYRTTVDDLFRVVYRWTRGKKALTEDIVQETYLRAVRTWREKGLPEDEAAWLRTVARNLLVSHYRKKRPEAVSPAEVESLPADPVHTEQSERILLIRWALCRLEAGYSSLLKAFHFDDLRIRTIAEREGLTERAVEGRLRRARLAMRAVLGPLLKKEERNRNG